MTLTKRNIRWAIECVRRHGDGDIFPSLPEIAAVSAAPDVLVNALAKAKVGDFPPQPARRFIVPKNDLSFRQATQLHPQDSILLTALVLKFGAGIERRRQNSQTVFSYRFRPHLRHGLYGPKSFWNDFWQSAQQQGLNASHVLYCDIADFYNQIYHHSVENQLAESGFSNQSIKWIKNLLNSLTERMSRGIPIGPHAIHLIAESTLIPVDNSLRASGLDFIRYADDILVFGNSDRATRRALFTVAKTLDKQQRLTLQEHKTRIFTSQEFQQHCQNMIEDSPINDVERAMTGIVHKYTGGDPYMTVTYDKIDPADWESITTDAIKETVEAYLNDTPTDYVKLSRFYRRLMQIGHPGALSVTMERMGEMLPCLPIISRYIAAARTVSDAEWGQIGSNLLDILDENDYFSNDYEFIRLCVLSLFVKNRNLNHFYRMAEQFGSSNLHTRREILLAAQANKAFDWLREHREDYASMDRWQQMAYLYCCMGLPREERIYFLKNKGKGSCFDECLVAWARNARK